MLRRLASNYKVCIALYMSINIYITTNFKQKQYDSRALCYLDVEHGITGTTAIEFCTTNLVYVEFLMRPT